MSTCPAAYGPRTPCISFAGGFISVSRGPPHIAIIGQMIGMAAPSVTFEMQLLARAISPLVFSLGFTTGWSNSLSLEAALSLEASVSHTLHYHDSC